MARGWESKSVEEQQSEFTNHAEQIEKAAKSAEDRQRTQHRQALQLARTNVQNQFNNSQSDRLRQLLQQELDHLDAEMSKLKP